MLQVEKLIFLEAELLRQRAADLEREVGEEEAGLMGNIYGASRSVGGCHVQFDGHGGR